MDTFNMTPEEFKKFAWTKKFENLSNYDKFDIVWLRLQPEIRRVLTGITRDNSLEQIKDSILEKDIYRLFHEATYVLINIEFIVSQIKSYDDGLPLNLFC